MARNVYVTPVRICHTYSVEYGIQNVSYSVGFSFSMLAKTYLSLAKNAHNNRKNSVYVTYMYFQ